MVQRLGLNRHLFDYCINSLVSWSSGTYLCYRQRIQWGIMTSKAEGTSNTHMFFFFGFVFWGFFFFLKEMSNFFPMYESQSVTNKQHSLLRENLRECSFSATKFWWRILSFFGGRGPSKDRTVPKTMDDPRPGMTREGREDGSLEQTGPTSRWQLLVAMQEGRLSGAGSSQKPENGLFMWNLLNLNVGLKMLICSLR